MLDDPEKCYEDTSIFIFRVGCSRTTWLSYITEYLSRLLPDFKEVGAPFDPERPNTYSWISQLIATYNSHLVRVEPESSLEFITNIYPLRITFTNNPHVFAWKYYPPDRRWPVFIWLAPLRLRLQMHFYSSLNYSGIIRLLSIDRTNGYDHSYRSLANQSFESATDSLTVHSTRLGTLGNFPGHGSLTSIDSSCYLSDTF